MGFSLAQLPPFDPRDGELVFEPEKGQVGYWVGCPGVNRFGGRYYMTYRRRRPRDVEAERGWRCAIATSVDGVHFRDLWVVHKDQLNTSSMEKFCLTQNGDGSYTLYLSYVDPADGRWRIDALDASHPSMFDVAKARTVLTAASTGTEGVKDPYVVKVGPVTYMFASYAAAKADIDLAAHSTGDIYNVGATTHPTGLAISVDEGRHFEWRERALIPGTGWNKYQTRLNSVVRIGGDFVGFYDGSRDYHENFEEHCGLAVSGDLIHWQRLCDDGPWVVSPYTTGSVRYVDANIFDGEWWLYYEMTREDGAHELRVYRAPVKNRL